MTQEHLSRNMWLEAQLSHRGNTAVRAAVDACVETRRLLVAWRVVASVNTAVACSARGIARWAHLYERSQLQQVVQLEFESKCCGMLRRWQRTMLRKPFSGWFKETVRRRRRYHAKNCTASFAARMQRRSTLYWWDLFVESTYREQVQGEGSVIDCIPTNEERREAYAPLCSDEDGSIDPPHVSSEARPFAMNSNVERSKEYSKEIRQVDELEREMARRECASLAVQVETLCKHRDQLVWENQVLLQEQKKREIRDQESNVMAAVATWAKVGEILAMYYLKLSGQGLLLWKSTYQRSRGHANVLHAFEFRRHKRHVFSVIHAWQAVAARRRLLRTRVMAMRSRSCVAAKGLWYRSWRQVLLFSSMQQHIVGIALRQCKRRLAQVHFKAWRDNDFISRQKAEKTRNALRLHNRALLKDAVRCLRLVRRLQMLQTALEKLSAL